MADSIDTDDPDDGDTVSASLGIAAGGTYNADVSLVKVWATVIRSTATPPASPWEASADEFVVNLPAGSGTWSISGVNGTVAGSDNRLIVWGGFSGSAIARLTATLPEFIGDMGGTTGTGIDETRRVSSSCKACGGVARVLVATIGQSQCEPLVGRKVKLRWSGEHWQGLMKFPDGHWVTWRLEGKACTKCTPNHFRLSCGDRKSQRPGEVCCSPFELVWNGKQALKIGIRGSKSCPPGTTAEITVSE